MNLSFQFSINYPMLIVTFVGMPLLLYVLRKVALKTGLVDMPNARKIHANPVPLIGGLALFIMAIVLMAMINNVSEFGFFLIIATGLVVIVGLLDDLYQLSALWRFVAQIVASLVVIYFTGVQLDTFGFLLLPNWQADLGYLAIPVTVFGVVGVINALNMADGIDGLAAMTFFTPVLVLVIIAQPSDFSLWLLYLLMCLMVFVLFNTSQVQKIFLGDNGSLMLGFILAWLLVYFSQGSSAVIKPVMALYLVGLPVYDTIFVMLRRIINKKSPFKPDNTHLHHLFLAKGFSQVQTLIAMMFSQMVLIGIGVIFLFTNVAEYLQFYVFVSMSAIYYFTMQKVWDNQKGK